MGDFPCHAGPTEGWCDRDGLAGFMGHTCVKPEPVKLTRDELMILLIEECGEVIQAATKCLRFGYDVDHGTGYGNNRDHLATELGDLTAVRDELDIDSSEPFMAALRSKIARAVAAKAKYGRTMAPAERGSAE